MNSIFVNTRHEGNDDKLWAAYRDADYKSSGTYGFGFKNFIRDIVPGVSNAIGTTRDGINVVFESEEALLMFVLKWL